MDAHCIRYLPIPLLCESSKGTGLLLEQIFLVLETGLVKRF